MDENDAIVHRGVKIAAKGVENANAADS